MKRSKSDAVLTFALSVSLVVHFGLWIAVVREKVAFLTAQLFQPAVAPHYVLKTDEDETDQPATVIQESTQTVEDFALALPPPPPPKQPAKKPADKNDENIEWGEKDGKGFAITSAPGKNPMSARKGVEDQSFASRDPEGPQPFPDDPSMSTVPPGENGDGKKPVRDPLAGKGTQGDPMILLGHPQPAATPPPPTPRPIEVATAQTQTPTPQTSGPSVSVLPSPERRSPAESNSPPAERDSLVNDPARNQDIQILPRKPTDLIAIRSNRPGYPEIVEALTQPPGLKLTPQSREPIEDLTLASVTTADIPSAPRIQPATAIIQSQPRQLEEIAQRLGETDPLNGPSIVEALTYAPGEIARQGGDAPLMEVARADRDGGESILSAITPLTINEPPPDELAQKIETPAEPQVVLVSNGAVGSAASATGGVPGPPVPAADPAPDTGFESDPFAKIPGVEFKNGAVEARSGRQVKPIRPRLTEAGRRDLLAMQFPTILCKVRIDKTGKVVDVRVVRGSGSEAIDMPVYRCLWGWYFEPPKDKTGNPLEDIQLVAIHWG